MAGVQGKPKYAHVKPDSARLLDIKPDLPARNIAEMIAAAMMETGRTPYWFSSNHDVRPPKCLACPLHYDWVLKDRVGIKTLVRDRARRWIVAAVLHGYQVNREGGRPLTSSLEIARRRASLHQQIRDFPDDDIPF